jgi:hypothetical protein
VLRRAILVATGLLIVAGLVALHNLGSPEGFEHVTQAAVPAAAEDAIGESEAASLTDSASRKPLFSAPEETLLVGDPEDGEMLEYEYGSVSGMIFDALGVPSSGAKVAFSFGADIVADRTRRAVSDDLGFYELPRLRVGTWTVFFFGTPSDLTPRGSRLAAVRVGEVEIFANLHSPFDIVLEGNRRLSGAFAMSDIPGGMIELELTPEWAVDSVSASGWVITPIAKEGKEVGGERGEPRERRLVPGQFTFEGLMPSVYRLKITFGHDTESGEELFLERTIDLSDGDVSLEAETFTLLDFAFPTHER